MKPQNNRSKSVNFTPSNQYWAETHVVTNLPKALESYNLYTSDRALIHWTSIFCQDKENAALSELGEYCGRPEVIEWGAQANHNKPELFTHDRYGQRIDEVKFHPAYHQLMSLSMANGLHSSHWLEQTDYSHVERAAKYYMVAQVEAGHGCPITMTSAAIPALKNQPEIFELWRDKILNTTYDPRNVSHEHKQSVTIGMAMTEKQGGSDVRLNTTRAFPINKAGGGELYELVGHKYFVSAPMCDAFLVLAQTDAGVSCFLVPRWRPDGTKNPIQIQRLKNKMGNVSNASSETELRGAQGWLIGEEGRGIATILEMVAMTRFDCMIGSSAQMRQAVAQITHHCQERVAFGNALIEQPLMQNVLADLILESEAALAMTMRLARAFDQMAKDNHEMQLVRLGTALGKYWICKRAPGHAYEAMECIGGSGVMEDSIMPRLFRESPINAIWEGSGNVQCLDMLRALVKQPDSYQAYLAELKRASGKNAFFDQTIIDIQGLFNDQTSLEYRSRTITEKMALALQASTLLQYGDPTVADGFCQARLAPHANGLLYGNLSEAVDCKYIIERGCVHR
ncbi:acyl-CoA dehydrogenase family protein [Thalassotalea sp. LPB0316]|uniref:acyl-CoA dehydrogenase family protein n=1 Tax=Thalassotalea sp. LPB0316 TaxID=2769490 RepID=UPI0018663291|nr:acyl-CoA dehydrogenase family protein [Thalassotalea sp. LPB0316]QOL26420.1 acyl-CoA dehydrogenase family protein [Thalassotalea sp. LPB0316]